MYKPIITCLILAMLFCTCKRAIKEYEYVNNSLIYVDTVCLNVSVPSGPHSPIDNFIEVYVKFNDEFFKRRGSTFSKDLSNFHLVLANGDAVHLSDNKSFGIYNDCFESTTHKEYLHIQYFPETENVSEMWKKYGHLFYEGVLYYDSVKVDMKRVIYDAKPYPRGCPDLPPLLVFPETE